MNKGKPSEKEESYFLQKEVERLQALKQEHLAKTAAAQREEMKALHHMRCAKCGQKMETEVMAGVEIEICPDCGGIYLDAGELPKLLSQSVRIPFAESLGIFRPLWKP